MGFFIFLIVLLILFFLLEKTINKLLGIKVEKKISETSGKNVDRWGRGILFVSFLCSLPFFMEQETSVLKWYYMIVLISVQGFQSIMEWKYLKNSKQYVSTLIYLILGIVFIYNIEIFLILLDFD